jgi:hypothetical protein
VKISLHQQFILPEHQQSLHESKVLLRFLMMKSSQYPVARVRKAAVQQPILLLAKAGEC